MSNYVADYKTKFQVKSFSCILENSADFSLSIFFKKTFSIVALIFL